MSEAGIISGYAIRWSDRASIGSFLEQFDPSAFREHLRTEPDVVALWSHQDDRPLGRVSNRTLRIRPDAVGLWYTLAPDSTSPDGQEAIASVRSGLVHQVSIGFWPDEENWSWADDDTPLRTITKAELREISLVTWPAYQDTSAHYVAPVVADRSSSEVSKSIEMKFRSMPVANHQAAKRRIDAKQRARGILK
ncbi:MULTISPECIES: HK97 family phage prohead protease [unclassified Bradyrhizobium]|uniref:HK97 family phage prohead protease n=1 Tax=unclassified Bradyrhizobium TaxID=2631580 RepID=UPI001CD5F4C5|nr:MULTISPECIES: HK97 family phage prohead protease [unclassified Bradyrhizobium]MCA1378886.1 HK97 family phage prohead protease [Bradyrhizobium sp. IC4060]MCA1488906.1 HK97 family phage prohead protease [Bradyrhizobium sp. IC4061]